MYFTVAYPPELEPSFPDDCYEFLLPLSAGSFEGGFSSVLHIASSRSEAAATHGRSDHEGYDASRLSSDSGSIFELLAGK